MFADPSDCHHSTAYVDLAQKADQKGLFLLPCIKKETIPLGEAQSSAATTPSSLKNSDVAAFAPASGIQAKSSSSRDKGLKSASNKSVTNAASSPARQHLYSPQVQQQHNHLQSNSEITSEGGPSELTLVFYSVFMASSSLLFGGLTLWHARQRDGQGVEMLGAGVLANIVLQWQRFLDWHQLVLFHLVEFMQSMDPRTFAWLMSTLCLLVLLGESHEKGQVLISTMLTGYLYWKNCLDSLLDQSRGHIISFLPYRAFFASTSSSATSGSAHDTGDANR